LRDLESVEQEDTQMTIVSPFNLAEGDYLELHDHRFVGPLHQRAGGLLFADGSPAVSGYWSSSGVPYAGAPRIRTVMKGQAGIAGYIDRMSSETDEGYSAFAAQQIALAREALARVLRAPAKLPVTPSDDVSTSAKLVMAMIQVLVPEIRKVVAEEVAKELEAFEQNRRRYVVTLEPAP
jgi:hypothetical protein